MNKELKKELLKIIKSLDGNILSVSIDDTDINNAILKNDNVKNNLIFKSKTKLKTDPGFDNVSIRKLKKKIKIKVDSAVCDVNGINMYLWKFVRHSYNLVSDKIIFFGLLDNYDISKLENKYKRYGCKTSIKKISTYFIMIIDIDNLKIKWYKKFINNIKDLFIDALDVIGNSLMQ